ncbi:bifunctional DNA-formamidopyrimidine glycosylase/DNA-(apurinic or apyrimidinic site) lyase [Inquilinus sp. YAF38]|uniref:bifunctional DNA-formamidopyrimidine glycosylase/DNA-(apurinic or apyrimidinic site) lyase n=1 Tax=Inquilinus sp. YAF38 TaxID=3233084 RepID=UPI003F903955
MPELPEVETVRRGLVPVLEGQRLARVEQRRPDLRFPLPERMVERLTGRRVVRLDRRAKYLLIHLDDGMVLLIHLGMSGRMMVTQGRPQSVSPHDHVVFETEAGSVVTFNDARRFGMMDLVSQNALHTHKALEALGPEPLSDEFDAAYLDQVLARKITPIKAALLDQRVVAGLGNIYVCEALWAAHISPRRVAASVAGVRAARLVPEIKAVLQRAIEAGGSSLRDYVQVDGELGYFQHSWSVYDREGEPCRTPGCRGTVRRLVQSGRSTFFCPVCQR